ncbi:hypothetical protein AB3X91_30765 [Paraburkholderia sp. BR14263]|uniref:hypothetical protein n=1 Tax=unclassified Paraburkholderia TaxID=2615204 RepID=UPI0034CD47F1
MLNRTNPIQPAKPPINDQMQIGAMRIALTIEELTAQGYVVIGIEYSSHSRPTIQVQNSALCHELVERGEATYYRTGAGENGRYRIGQFKSGDVRVLWMERGN